MTFRKVALVLGMVVLAGCDAPVSPDNAVAAPVAEVAFAAAAPAGGFGDLLNAARQAAGLPPAVADARLQRAAQAHADDMVARNYFSHTAPNGSRSSDRIAAAGVSTCRPAENIAFGQSSAAAAFQTWNGSGAHRDNMMMAGQLRFGLGQNGTKWVLTLAPVC